MRVSKSDGSQVFDLQRDALLAADIIPERIYEDLASGRKDDRPGLAACLKALQPGNTLVIWKLDPGPAKKTTKSCTAIHEVQTERNHSDGVQKSSHYVSS